MVWGYVGNVGNIINLFCWVSDKYCYCVEFYDVGDISFSDIFCGLVFIFGGIEY